MIRRLFTVLLLLSVPLCGATLLSAQDRLGPDSRSDYFLQTIVGTSFGPFHPSPLAAMATVSILLAPVPLIWLVQALGRRMGRRHKLGSCRTCGYDLTGNVSGICPECGTPIVHGP